MVRARIGGGGGGGSPDPPDSTDSVYDPTPEDRPNEDPNDDPPGTGGGGSSAPDPDPAPQPDPDPPSDGNTGNSNPPAPDPAPPSTGNSDPDEPGSTDSPTSTTPEYRPGEDPGPDTGTGGDVPDDSTDSPTSTTPENRPDENPGVDRDADQEDTDTVTGPTTPEERPNENPNDDPPGTEYLPGTNIPMSEWREWSENHPSQTQPDGTGGVPDDWPGTDAEYYEYAAGGDNGVSNGDNPALPNEPVDQNPNSPVGDNDLDGDGQAENPFNPGSWDAPQAPTFTFPEVPTPPNPFDSGPLGWIVDNLVWAALFVVGLVTLYLLKPLLEIGANASEVAQ